MQPIEQEGRTVAEAVDAALHANGLRREQVEVTVLNEGTAGFMGLGAQPARVRLSEKRWGDGPIPAPPKPKPATHPRGAARTASRAAAPTPAPAPTPTPAPRTAPVPRTAPAPERRETRRDESPKSTHAVTPAESAEACAKAQVLLTDLLKMMGIAAPSLSISWDTNLERVKISVESQDAPVLVGRDGRVLESLQYLASLMINRGSAAPIAVQVDALSYWEKREAAILDEARRGIAAAMADQKPCRLEPMDAAMRRLIHRTFAANPDITTSSEGEGPWRKIVIRPRTA